MSLHWCQHWYQLGLPNGAHLGFAQPLLLLSDEALRDRKVRARIDHSLSVIVAEPEPGGCFSGPGRVWIVSRAVRLL